MWNSSLKSESFFPNVAFQSLSFPTSAKRYLIRAFGVQQFLGVYDGMMCVKDIVRYSNMAIKEASIYYGEEQVSKVFPLDHTVCRQELISVSRKTINDLVQNGDLMWAPAPDSGYKAPMEGTLIWK